MSGNPIDAVHGLDEGENLGIISDTDEDFLVDNTDSSEGEEEEFQAARVVDEDLKVALEVGREMGLVNEEDEKIKKLLSDLNLDFGKNGNTKRKRKNGEIERFGREFCIQCILRL